MLRAIVTTLLVCLLFAGCARHEAAPPAAGLGAAGVPEQKQELEPGTWVMLDETEARAAAGSLDIAAQGLRSWNDLAPAIRHSMAWLSSKDTGSVAVAQGGLRITWGELLAAQRNLLALLPQLDAQPALLASHFRWYRLSPSVDFTGYYEPVLRASRTRKAGYPQAIYRVPDDMRQLDLGQFNSRYEGQRITYRLEGNKVLPYHDRAAIDERGALRGKGYELAWAQDPVDVFFLQVQGSGRLQFDDGSNVHVLYAGQNGRPYASLGRVMRERGILPPDGVNMDAIRAWLAANPGQAQQVMNANPSYVFFRLANEGPNGSMGRALLPWVSLAVDRSVIPLGAVTTFAVDLPGGSGETGSLHGIGLAQDTGGAIKGRRIDLFCGSGDRAKTVAGHLDAAGQVWLLLPR